MSANPESNDFFVETDGRTVPDACIPIFRMEAIEDKLQSESEGRPIFKEVPWIKILIPGAAGKDEVDCRVNDKHKERFSRQWDAFNRNRENIIEGTMIDQWGLITRIRAAELKACNILTVEQLAEVADQYLKKLGPGGMELRQKAVAYLASTKGDSNYKETQTMLNELKLKVQELEEQTDELQKENATANAKNAALNEKLSDMLLSRDDKPTTKKKVKRGK